MSFRRSVYLDHSATTPTDPRVVEVMLPYFTGIYGNPASAHSLGRQAESAIEIARETVAHILNCQPSEIMFTSGGSESDNLAIRDAAWSSRQQGKGAHLITLPIEHDAVLKTVDQLATVMGFEHTLLPVDHQGVVDVDHFATAFRKDTTLASIMLVNNEVGSLQPVSELASIAKEHGVLLHTDAVQAAGQLPLNVQELGVDMLSLSAHKFYGPKGVGLLYVRDGTSIRLGRSERDYGVGSRDETQNVPLIVGLAKALELAYAELDLHLPHYCQMRDMLIGRILNKVPGIQLTGHPLDRLPSHASFIIDGVESNTLVMHLDTRGIAASSASACKTGSPEPSNVLLAMGFSPKEASGSLRLTVGRQTTEADVDYTVSVLVDMVEKLRKLKREWVL